uniref:Protein RRP5 homolog n=1 Tax=Paramormyrops kingsleyae TaxID=1676925 RepID=A0A3B3R7H3_9TELE|nr:protein RRP5 homolog isoform X1 [Paramormyrops kingsleyae]XP_023653779.1 protein RRP5 homolog isoform X1 [Paramormyrops kingsleyae]
MASLEEDFPRGGTSKKTAGSKSTVERIEVDNLFQICEPEVKKRKSSKGDAKGAKKQRSSKEGSLKLNTAEATDILSFKNIKVGTLFLGCVKEVTDFQVTVSLPNGLKGFLPVGNVSASFTKMLTSQLEMEDSLEEISSLPSLFPPGKLLRCVVSGLETTQKGHTSVRLSINPKEVNKGFTPESLKAGMMLSGCVESIEDHGFLVDIGVSGTKAFLPKGKEVKGATKQGGFKVGQHVDCVLKEVKNEGRIVLLATTSSAITQSCAETQHGWTLRNLLPGLMVKAQVQKVGKHRLFLEFLSSFSGTVDFLHMDRDKASSYNPGETLKACVLYVEPSSRSMGLSLREHLLNPGPLLEPVTSDLIGEVFEDCRMTSLHPASGAILELPEKMAAFVHKQHLKDIGETFTSDQVMAKSSHTCRILDFSPLEQMHTATLRRAIVDAMFFRYQDFQPGQLVEGTVSSLLTFGVIVELTDYIKGMVPRIHLADVVLKNPEKVYKVGSKVKCRVLSVDRASQKLLLTRKKALLSSTLPLISSYSGVRVGQVSHGWIVSVQNFGCIVRFFGDVKGLVPVGELSKERVSVPQSLFYVGQVVKAKVLSCDAAQEKLLLSFRAVADKESQATRRFSFETGKEVEAKVLRKHLEGLEVSILPEDAPAFLPIGHLSDHMSNCSLFWGALKEGDTLSNTVSLRTNKSNTILTQKPLVKAAITDGLVAKEFSDIQVGMHLVGWIKDVMPYGVFVEFPYGLVGLAPKSAMSDKFVSNTESVFQKGQTVAAKVTDLDEEKRRFLLSLKVSEVCFEEGDSRRRLVQGLQERNAVAEMVAAKDPELLQYLRPLAVGQKLKLAVDVVSGDKSATFVRDGLSGVSIVATPDHLSGVTLTSGQKVTAIILHVDPCASKIYVSLAPQLLGKRKKLNAGAKLSATVQYVERDFAVISLGDSGHLTIVHTTVHLNDTFRFKSEKMAVGRTLNVTVKEARCEDLGGLPLVSWTSVSASTPSREKKAIPEGVAVSRKHTYKKGDVLTGTVKSVKPLCVFVSLPGGVRGSIHVSQIQETFKKACSFPTASLKKGKTVTARVIGERECSDHKLLPISHPESKFTELELTLLPSLLKEEANLEDIKTGKKLKAYQAGQDVTCFVSKYDIQKKWLKVILTPSVSGTVDVLAMTLDRQVAKYPERMFKMGQALPAKVVGLDSSKKRLSLSLIGVCRLTPGTVTLGRVQELLANSGLVVSLPFSRLGYVSVVDLADSYRPKPLEGYWVGKIVRCCVVGEEPDHLQLSLRASRMEPETTVPVKDPEISSIGDLKRGRLVRGYVKHVGAQGVFIRLSRTITGLARFEHVTSYHVTDKDIFAKHIPLHALYTTKVLRVNKKEGQVELSLLPEDTGKPDILPESLALPLRERGQENKTKDSKKRKRLPGELHKHGKIGTTETAGESEEDDSGVDAYFHEEEEEAPPKKPKKALQPVKAGQQRLQVAGGFSWDLGLSALRPAVSQKGADRSDEEDEQAQKKSRKDKEVEKQQAERVLSKLESELMDPSLRPESASSFERLVLSSPNSSLVWLQYMAFHLQATEIEQARAVGERALKTISFREEQEKLNVWVALLNLENLYGSQESLQKVFERALQYCEPLAVYQQLADVYAKSDKHKEAEALYKNMVKRFRQDRSVWLSYGTFLLRQGQNDAAHSVLQRALRSLPDKEHVDLIVKFAQLEFQHGDVDRAKSMFDRTLTSYPKRTDLWSVYIDLMIKHGPQKEVRDLFDRVIHLSVAVKRIKFFFKRYLEYEKKSGTAESVQAVKEKALQYVEAKGAEGAEAAS